MSIVNKSPVAQLDADIATLQVIVEESISAVETNGLPQRNYNLVQEIMSRWSSFSDELGQLSGRVSVVMVRLLIDILLGLKAEISAKWTAGLVVIGLLSGRRVNTLAEVEEAILLAKANFSALPGIKADDVLNLISKFKMAFPNYVLGSRKIRGLTGTADFYDAVRSQLAMFLGTYGPDSVATPLKVSCSSLPLQAVSCPITLQMISNYVQPVANLAADAVLTLNVDVTATVSYDCRVFATGNATDANSPIIQLGAGGNLITVLNGARRRLVMPAGTEITFRNGLVREAKLFFDDVVADLPAGFFSSAGDATKVRELVGSQRAHWTSDYGFVSVAREYVEYIRSKGIRGFSIARYFALRFADLQNQALDDPVPLTTDAEVTAFVNDVYPACPENDVNGLSGLTRGEHDSILLQPDFWLGDSDVRTVGGNGTYSISTKRKMYAEYINLIVWLVDMASSDGGFADWLAL